MEELQVDIKRRGQSDIALQDLVSHGAGSLWKSTSVSVVSVEKAGTKKIDRVISELGMPLDIRNISYLEGKWLDDLNPRASPAISLKLDGSDDQKAQRILLLVLPYGSAFTALSESQLQGLLILIDELKSIGCKVVILTSDDGNSAFLQECKAVGVPVVTNAETSIGLSAVFLAPWAKPAI